MTQYAIFQKQGSQSTRLNPAKTFSKWEATRLAAALRRNTGDTYYARRVKS